MTAKTMKTLTLNNGDVYEIVDEKSRNDIEKLNETMRFYVVTNHGISTENEDNTPALQALVDSVNENGGGIIYFPIGRYYFKRSSIQGTEGSDIDYAAVWMKSNVSIIGENLRQTIFEQTEAVPYAMFAYQGINSNPIIGCTYSNFTVTAYTTAGNEVYSKAFSYQYVRDCVFRDLILRGTLATGLGIDFLDRVTIENVTCIDCGRAYDGTHSGRSGIGIGTGGWEHEIFFIHNCVCKSCGNYGIFIENQYNLGWGGSTDLSKGCIISNCIVYNGANKGIGIHGGQNATVIGCEVYENTADGIFIDGKCKNVKILSCNTANNGGNGIQIATTLDSDKIIAANNMVDSNALDGIVLSPTASLSNILLKNNTILDNTQKGVNLLSSVDSFVLMDNYIKSNTEALCIPENYEFNDCVIKGNVIFGSYSTMGVFGGDTSFNELLESSD